MGASIARSGASILALGILCFGASGCLSGSIYSHVTQPLDLNLDRTQFEEGRQVSSWKTLRIPITGGLFVQADWGSSAIGEAARQEGLTEIYYADREVLSVLGIWTQRWAIVHGR